MPNTLKDSLISSGFDPSMADIYLALAEAGETTVGKLVEKTSLSRAGAYDALNYLLGEKFVEYRKEGRNAYYKLAHPEKLRDLLTERKREVQTLEDELGNTIKAVTGMYNLSQNKPGVRFFEGVDGLQQIYEDTLSTPNSTIYALLSPAIVHPELKKWLDDVYLKQRVAKKIEAKVIASSSKETDWYYQQDKTNLRETAIIPSADNPIDIEIDIYGENKVAFISYSEKEMVGVIIESPAIHRSMRTFFNLSWAQAKITKNAAQAAFKAPSSITDSGNL